MMSNALGLTLKLPQMLRLLPTASEPTGLVGEGGGGDVEEAAYEEVPKADASGPTGHPANENAGSRPPGKKRNDKPQSCMYCVAKKKPGTDQFMGSCPWLTGASKSHLPTTLPNLCLGCF